MAKKLVDEDAGPNGCDSDIFLKHYREIRKARHPMEQATAQYRIARKQAKSAGVSLQALALMENLAKMDPDEARAMLKQFGIYSALTKQGYVTQLDLFDTASAQPSAKSIHAQQLFDADEAGRLCGAKGGNKNENPHKPGSELHVAWEKGFNNGWEFWEASGGPAKREKTASGRGRGRPPGKKAADAPAVPRALAAATSPAPAALQ